MLLLFSLFAFGALGDVNKQCYGKTIEDYMGCALVGGDEVTCGKKTDKCMFGKGPARVMGEKMEQCMKDAGKVMFKGCDMHVECARECGNLCIDVGFGGSCSGCMGMGIKEDCDKAIEMGLKCQWSGSDPMVGMCLEVATCHGKMPIDYHMCKKHGYNSVACLEDPKCDFGVDPVEMQVDEYKTCVEDGNFAFKKCESKEDCTMCSTGQMCLDMGFQKACMGCADMGIKADCDAGKEAGLKCVWSGESEDVGTCIADMSKPGPKKAPKEKTPSPVVEKTPMPVVAPTEAPKMEDECSPKNKKECKKAKDTCDYKGGKCMLNYEPECVGLRTDVHHKCTGKKTKEECDAVKQPPFMKALCKWGKNTIDMEVGLKKCLADNKISAPMKCESTRDCMCGQVCFEMFGMKSCSSCADMGIKEDCDNMRIRNEVPCKFVGDDVMGVCIQEDPCKTHSLDKNACEGQSTCMFKDDKCMTMMADKKTCKKRGKDKKATMMSRKIECEELTGCQWSEKKGKGKCKFAKVKK